jgi:3-oxoacyl-[acyl-carrier-protein] synthase-3
VAYIREFGSFLPARVVDNREMGAMVGCDAEWIWNVAGILTRRFANSESLVDLAVHAAEDCLTRAAAQPQDIGLVLFSTGTSPRRFPGPAAELASRLGLDQTPALDIPMASAGSVFALALAGELAGRFGNTLIVAAERMSDVILQQPMERGVAVLFGDAAGACLVSPDHGRARILDSLLQSDGAFAQDLRLDFNSPISMSGRSVILQASRKVPRAIMTLLDRNNLTPAAIDVFLMHQANQNLIVRIAQALNVREDTFFSNIDKYGNTSSASMLVAAKEWLDHGGFRRDVPVCFAGFGAGFHWGAVLASGV